MYIFDLSFLKKPEAVAKRRSVRKGVIRNFANSQKNTCVSFFFNKVAGLRPATLLKRILVQVFSCKFCKISKNSFSYRTPPVTASEKYVRSVFQTILRIIRHKFICLKPFKTLCGNIVSFYNVTLERKFISLIFTVSK